MKKQSGFTLIELVVVIVILGILAATALPKFVDLTDDAETAAIKGVAGGLASAAAMNYGGCAATGQSVSAGKCVKVTKCSEVGQLMNPTLTLGTAASATTYYLSSDAAVAANGTAISCGLVKDKPAGTPKYQADFAATSAGI